MKCSCCAFTVLVVLIVVIVNHNMMIDVHDRCEWVNVSSGTDSPGLSWTKSMEP